MNPLPVGGGRQRQLPAGAVMAVGGRDRAALVPHRDPADRMPQQGIDEMGIAVAEDAEDDVDVLGEPIGQGGGDGG
nr:hypothetical protein [Enemella evansiae]